MSKVTNIKEALTCTDLQVSQLVRENEAVIKLFIVKELGNTLEFMGFDKSTISNNVVQMLVDEIVSTYFYLHLEDISLVFRYARKGRYTKLYGRIDGMTILSWFAEYDKERDAMMSETQYYPEPQQGGISHEEYVKGLEEKAKSGDADAVRALEAHKEVQKFLDQVKYETRLYREARNERLNKLIEEDEKRAI